MAKKPTNEVAVRESGDLMVVEGTQVPDYINQGSGRGQENVGMEDIITPRLEVVQGLSPYVKEGDPKYNPEAKPGLLVNSVTGQIYGKEVMVVPVMFIKQWLVWRRRKWVDSKGREQSTDGGFFGAFDNPMDATDRMNEEIQKSGIDERSIEVLDTPQHLCLLVNFNAGSVDEVMVSMPRTKAKVSRQWNSMVRMAGGDRFGRVYRLTTAMEEKNGNSYYNFVVAQAGFPAQAIYAKASKLYDQIAAGGRTIVVDNDDFDSDHEERDIEM